jgi:hypothetical protein
MLCLPLNIEEIEENGKARKKLMELRRRGWWKRNISLLWSLVMSASDHAVFRLKMQGAQQAYKENQDNSKYFVNSAVAAAQLWLADFNASQQKLRLANKAMPAALTAAAPALMAVMDVLGETLSCPVDERMTAKDWLEHFGEKIQSRYNAEIVGPTKQNLKTVYEALKSLGLVS